jgi:hypothetical protein
MAVLAIASVHDLVRLGDAVPWSKAIDLPDFYCAGRAVAHGESPYGVEPLRSCEHAINRGSLWRNPLYLVPAPQPPMDFLPYAALSFLTYPAARIVAAVAIAAAVVVTALALANMGLPFWASLGALALSDGFVEISQGQIVPFALLSLVFAALMLERGRHWIAGLLCVLTMIEPHVGGPACAGLFLYSPRSRVAMIVGIAGLVVVSVAAVGIQACVEWAMQIIPGQALAEARLWNQYSLTAILADAGVPVRVALAAGTVCFLVMLCVGLWLGKRLSIRYYSPAFVVLAPAAFSIVGGTYVHVVELPAAIPFLLLLVQHVAPRLRVTALISLVLIAIPWPFAQALKALFFPSLLATFLICWDFGVAAKTTAAILIATAAALWGVALHTPPALPLPRLHSGLYDSRGNVATAWTAIAGNEASMDVLRVIAKIPTWLGLLAMLTISLKEAPEPLEPATNTG